MEVEGNSAEGLTSSDGSEVNIRSKSFVDIFKCRGGKDGRSGENRFKTGE